MILYNGHEVLSVDGDLDWQLNKHQRLLDAGFGIGIMVSDIKSFIPCPPLALYPYDVIKAMSDLLNEIEVETIKFDPDSPEGDFNDAFIPSLKRITNQDQVLANFNAKGIKEDIFQNITEDERLKDLPLTILLLYYCFKNSF